MGAQMTYLSFATLDDRALSDVNKLETALGVILLAYEKLPEPASLTPAQLQQIQKMEQSMGVRLVAYT